MTRTRDAFDRALDRLEKEAQRLSAEHVEEGEFWAAFAGQADCIVEKAGAADCEHVHARLDRMLNTLGLSVQGLVAESFSAKECC